MTGRLSSLFTDTKKYVFLRALKNRSRTGTCFKFAEAEGFEPPVRFRTPVFKTGAIDHSAKLPCLGYVFP